VRSMVVSGLMIGIQPDAMRDMVPRDAWDIFGRWAKVHQGKGPGADAMTAEEYRDLVRRVDGD